MESMEKANLLIERLYQEGLDKNIWNQISAPVADFFDATNSLICFREIDQPSTPYFYAFAQDEPELETLFSRVPDGPMFGALRSEERGTALLSSIILKESRTDFDSYIENVWTPLGISHVLCGTAYRDSKVEAVLAVWRDQDAEDFTPSDIEQFEQLLKHIGRVFGLQHNASSYMSSNELMSSVMNMSSHALAVCNGKGEVLVQNNKLAKMLNEKRIVRMNNGRLRFNERSYQAELHSLLQNATGFGIAKEIGGLWIQQPGLDVYVTVFPFNSPTANYGDEPNCLLSIYDSSPSDNRSVYRSLFKLTYAEADLASRLAKGFTLSDIADDKGVSKHTVRSQLKSLFQKSGTSSQNELIALLNKVIPAVMIR